MTSTILHPGNQCVDHGHANYAIGNISLDLRKDTTPHTDRLGNLALLEVVAVKRVNYKRHSIINYFRERN